MKDQFWICFCLIPFAVWPINCYPETRNNLLINDQMMFPSSDEDDMIIMPRKRHFTVTPPPVICSPIQIYRDSNGKLQHRYVDCDKSKEKNTENRIGSNSPNDNVRSDVTTPTPTNRDKIVFPNERDSGEEGAKAPACAQGQTFCTEDDGTYPQNRIDELIADTNSIYQELLRNDLPEDDSDIFSRVDIPGEETMCDHETQTVYPTKAQNRQDQWLPVVNHANYTQGIRVEKCRNQDKPCKLAEIFPSNYRTKCVQKTQFRQLLALHSDGTLRPDYFAFPSCCVCVISSNRP